MSLNWVMLSSSTPLPFTPLSGEQRLYTSPPRIGLSINASSHYPAKQEPAISVTHPSGRLYLTNHRIIYLPDKPTEKLQSFAAPILNLHDSHVTAPFFGPNVWIALLQPVSGGGIPTPSSGVVELKLTFKEGGAFDFHSSYERVRERLHQVVSASRDSGGSTTASQAALHNVNLSSVNLEDLPAYQEESEGPLLSPVAAANASAQAHNPMNAPSGDAAPPRRANDPPAGTPAEPPPAYDDV